MLVLLGYSEVKVLERRLRRPPVIREEAAEADVWEGLLLRRCTLPSGDRCLDRISGLPLPH